MIIVGLKGLYLGYYDGNNLKSNTSIIGLKPKMGENSFYNSYVFIYKWVMYFKRSFGIHHQK